MEGRSGGKRKMIGGKCFHGWGRCSVCSEMYEMHDWADLDKCTRCGAISQGAKVFVEKMIESFKKTQIYKLMSESQEAEPEMKCTKCWQPIEEEK